MRAWTLACAAALLFGGCYSYELRKPGAPPVDAFAEVDGVGQICVLRPHWHAAAVTAVVHDDGRLVGATRGPTYFCYAAEPGHHVIDSKADTAEDATIEVEPGHRYYLHQIVDNIFGVVRTRLAWVTEDEAHRLIAKCGYRVLVGVPGNEELPSAGPVPALTLAGEAAGR
jgi:hypothetical protein